MTVDLPCGDALALKDHQLQDLSRLACRLAEASAAVILPHFRTALGVDNKASGPAYDPVTVADKAAETAIRKLLAEERPRDGIFGEEHGFEPGSSGLTWVIDPIDGTRAFITGMPLWGTLIALYDGARPVLGIMDQPYLRERFLGSRLGATLHGPMGTLDLRTRNCTALQSAALQCTSLDMFKRTEEQAAFQSLAERVQLVRFGGDCYAYCMLAHGLIDLVVEADLKPYDIQALIPLVEAAGGIVTNWSGGPAYLGGQVIAAGNRELHAQALEILSPAAL